MLKKKIGMAGILVAASGFLASNALAQPGWCPTATDYTIACNGCIRYLTCDVTGIPILITGASVTLDGQGHSISNSPQAGIKVFGRTATIKNVSVWYSGYNTSTTEGHGIYFVHPFDHFWSWVENVNIHHSKSHGIYNAGGGRVIISYSTISWNGGQGVLGEGLSGAYTGLDGVEVSQNNLHGFVARRNNSYSIYSNYYVNNHSGILAPAPSVSGLKIENNHFQGNYRGLFLQSTVAPRVAYNRRTQHWRSPLAEDCFDIDSTPGSYIGNTWLYWRGVNCTPQ